MEPDNSSQLINTAIGVTSPLLLQKILHYPTQPAFPHEHEFYFEANHNIQLCSLCFSSLAIIPSISHKPEISFHCINFELHHWHFTEISPLNIRVICCQCDESISLLYEKSILYPSFQKMASSSVLSQISACDILVKYISNVAFNGNDKWIRLENPVFHSKITAVPGATEILNSVGFYKEAEYMIPPDAKIYKLQMERALGELKLKIQILSSNGEMSKVGIDLLKPFGMTYSKRPSLVSRSAVILDDLSKPISPSYAVLGCTMDMTDAAIAWAFKLVASEDILNVPSYVDALADLAHGRQSDYLATQVLTANTEGLFSWTQICEAFDMLGISKYANIEDIIKKYNEQTLMMQEERPKLLRMLQIINSWRKSEELTMLIEAQMTHRRRGLKNNSNICYLNSVIQVLLSIPELRKIPINESDQSRPFEFIRLMRNMFDLLGEYKKSAAWVNNRFIALALGISDDDGGDDIANNINQTIGVHQDMGDCLNNIFEYLEIAVPDIYHRLFSIQLNDTKYRQYKLMVTPNNDVNISLMKALEGKKFDCLPEYLILQIVRVEFDVAAKKLRKNNDRMDVQISLNLSQYRTENRDSNVYNLFAVFIHEGEASYGHYWLYVCEGNGEWICCNDERIEDVSISQVLADAQGTSRNAYYIIYRKES